MIWDFKRCTSFAQFADMAAACERITRYHKTREQQENPLRLNLDYPDLKVKNPPLKLNGDVQLFTECSRKQWIEAKLHEKILGKDSGFVEILKGQKVASLIRDTAKVALFTHHIAIQMSENSQEPVLAILNARGASLYYYGFEPIFDQIHDSYLCKKFIKKVNDSALQFERPIAILETARQFIKRGLISRFVYPIRDFKISSHECVQTRKEALLLSGANPLKMKLRRRFIDGIPNAIEYIPEYFLTALKKGYPILFVDPPSWGTGYASSMGVDRKLKDIYKRTLGIFRPYKMKSYLDYAHYQIGCLSMSEMHNPTGEIIITPEEQLDTINVKLPFAILLNPEWKCEGIWWDNKPQVLGIWGTRFSAFYKETNRFSRYEYFDVKEKRRKVASIETIVSTSEEVMEFSAYIRKKVSWHIWSRPNKLERNGRK